MMFGRILCKLDQCLIILAEVPFFFGILGRAILALMTLKALP
jgi:hypothetical protein